jgi:hypothetical protein
MWARHHTVIDTKQIPDTAGYSVMGENFYRDRVLVEAVHGGHITVPNMTKEQILDAILLHERVEKSILDADNPIDDYLGAHEFATMAEHEYVRSLNAKPYQYEAALKSVIKFNETKHLTDVPLDLCCAPYLDEPDAEDKRALKEMLALGVEDAGKQSKEKVDYGKAKKGGDQCLRCASWMSGEQVELSPCRRVDGAVRWDRWCKLWSKRNGEGNGIQSSGGPDQQEPEDQESGGSPGGGNAQGQPGGEESEPEPQAS